MKTTTSTITFATLLGLFLAVAAPVSAGPSLTAAGYNTSRTGDVSLDFVAADINDVLKALAIQTGQNIVASTDVKGPITVSLGHVSLDDALNMITKLSGFQWANTGSSYVVGTASGLAALAGPGVSAEAAPETAVVLYRYANSDDLVSILKSRYPGLKVTPGTSINGTKAGSGAKAMVLIGLKSYLTGATDLINQVDATLGSTVIDANTEVYTVHYAALTDLMNILNALVPQLVVTPGPSQGFVAKAPSASAAASSSNATATSSSSSSGGSSGSGGSSSTGSSGTGSSQSTAIGPTKLLLTGSPADIAKAKEILKSLDTAPTQLLYEAKVTEVNVGDVNALGLNWDFSGAKTTFGELYNNGTAGQSLTTSAPNPPVDFPGQVFKFGTFGRSQITDLANVTMSALFTNSNTKLLADPNIAAIDGQPAQVFIGNTVNYVQSITTSTTGQNVTTASVDVGVILRVTGKVGDDGYITLNIHPEVSSITQFLPVPGGGSLPEVATRFADTTVRVRDGEIIAIGGLIQNSDLVTVNKVPGLGDIPIFGNLFRNNSKNKSRDEVIFFLKTSILKDS